MALADVFDALTSDRPYRKSLSCEQAVEYLQNEKCKAFDPDLTDIFTMTLKKDTRICSEVTPEVTGAHPGA